MTGNLNVTGMIDATALIPTGTLIHVTDGPHRSKKGRIRSPSGDGHILVDAHGEAQPIRVNSDHVAPANTTSKAVDDAIRTMAGRRRRKP